MTPPVALARGSLCFRFDFRGSFSGLILARPAHSPNDGHPPYAKKVESTILSVPGDFHTPCSGHPLNAVRLVLMSLCLYFWVRAVPFPTTVLVLILLARTLPFPTSSLHCTTAFVLISLVRTLLFPSARRALNSCGRRRRRWTSRRSSYRRSRTTPRRRGGSPARWRWSYTKTSSTRAYQVYDVDILLSLGTIVVLNSDQAVMLTCCVSTIHFEG